MPIRAMWTGGRVVTMRPLPSLVTRHSVPVSATPKFTPEMPNIRGQEGLAQHPAGSGGQGGDIVGERDAQLLVEGLADLAAAQVDGRGDDVRGRLAAQLDDIFAQVGLHHLEAGLLPGHGSGAISSLTMVLDLAISRAPCCWAISRTICTACCGIGGTVDDQRRWPAHGQ